MASTATKQTSLDDDLHEIQIDATEYSHIQIRYQQKQGEAKGFTDNHREQT
jgi:hypothetical protein